MNLTEATMADLVEALDHVATRQRLRAGTELLRRLDEYRANDISTARAEGFSWQDIAESIGTTRQAAWERYRHLDRIEALGGPERP